MMKEACNDIQKNMEKDIKRFKIAIDTGKAFTKSCYLGSDKKLKCDKFVSAIGMVPENTIQSDSGKSFYCDILKKGYYIDIPELCDITATSDNEKNGSGLSAGEHNHDSEIVTLSSCLAIVKAMKNLGIYNAVVDVAIGTPITEFEKVSKNPEEYFKSILPIGHSVKCRYEGVAYMFTVATFGIFPETIASFGLNRGNELGNLILVDIGGNNIQYICSTNGQIRYDKTKTFTGKGGVNNFVRRIRTLMIQNQIEPVGSFVEIAGWLSDPKSIPTKYGNNWKERFTGLVNDEKKRYFEEISQIFDPTTGNYKDEILRGYRICYTGGGSILFKDEIKASKGTILGGGEYANVMGFYGFL